MTAVRPDDIRTELLRFLDGLPQIVREHSYAMLAFYYLGSHPPPDDGGYAAEIMAMMYDADRFKRAGATIQVVMMLDYVFGSGPARISKSAAVMASLSEQYLEDEVLRRNAHELKERIPLVEEARGAWLTLRSDDFSIERLMSFEESMAGLGPPVKQG